VVPTLLRYLILLSLAASCTACGDDTHVAFCFGSKEFCKSVANADPIADAGSDQRATSGDIVTLDGSASRASGTGLRSFSWAQIEGPTQSISGATSSRPTFVATAVTATTDLVFQLTVVDDRGNADTDLTTVTIEPTADAAMLAAGELVAEDLRPPALDGTSECLASSAGTAEADAALSGLWLSARTRTVGDDAARAAVFLDEARRLVPMLAMQLSDRTGSIASALVATGLRELAAFAATRDPALAEDARKIVDLVPRPTGDVVGALRRGERTLVRGADDALMLAPSNVAQSVAAKTVVATRAACVGKPPIAMDPLRLITVVSEVLATPDELNARGAPAAATP
jgi:hypothetical protein